MDLMVLAQYALQVGGPKGLRPDGSKSLMLLLIQMGIIIAVLLIFWWMLRSHYRKSSFDKRDTPLVILDKRYAAGELTKEQYQQLKKDIGAK